MASRRWATTLSGSTPSASAWKVVTIRWRRTGEATWRMSAIVAANRPCRTARAFAARINAWPALGPAPQATHFLTSGGRLGLVGPAGADEVAGVDEHVFGHRDPADEVLQGHDLLGRERHLGLGGPVAGGLAEDLQLLGGGRVGDPDVEHEAVELGLGQG